MDAYDLSHKLAFIGRRFPVPFRTGPEYTNSVSGVPVLSLVRIFVEPVHWSEENLKLIAGEIARTLGPTKAYDVGITHTQTVYSPDIPASGNVARLMKLDADSPRVTLLIRDGTGDRAFEASYPRLQFEPTGVDFWRAIYDTSAVKLPPQQ